jgi:hypothetical protein
MVVAAVVLLALFTADERIVGQISETLAFLEVV